MRYSAEQLVRLARRENNSVRPYLFVNPCQGKHIPTSPEDAFGMCRETAALLNRACPDDRLFVIGFAETATGIAAAISAFLDNAVYYQNTTREHNGDEYLLFSEVHSHATDQMLRTAGTADVLRRIDRIVLIDDEVTTGNTICNLIRMIRTRFHADHLKFSILSVLNSMPEERLQELKAQGIDCLFLCRIPHEYRKESIMDVAFDPDLHRIAKGSSMKAVSDIVFTNPLNPRNPVRFSDYRKAAEAFAEALRIRLADGNPRPGRVLVIGTEEFMYPTFVAGEMIRRQRYADEVRIHSTTRSPIIASGKDGYPLFCRYQIRSPYDAERTTYIYNLQKYDQVFILTDAARSPEGICDLVSALETAGNRNISVLRWRYAADRETV